VFLAKLEEIVALYGKEYNFEEPVVCFDERPCYLIGERVEPLGLATGKVAKEHYAYEKHGSCCLLAAIEPLTGKRLGKVYEQRTRKEFSEFCQALDKNYTEAKVIHVVLDNLNTHSAGAFYEHLAADEAFKLAQRFRFHYTPKAASWLNMIEIEFSALARLCLNRRIATFEKLESEVLALLNERSSKGIKIEWQFSIQSCRTKLRSRYSEVNEVNGSLLAG